MMHAAFRKILSQSSLVLLFLFSCVDRIDFGVEMQRDFPLAIDGMITDEPGPYSVKVSTAFDIDSKINLRADAAVQEMLIIDDLGNTETLALARPGEYRTVTAGFRGVIGRAYQLRVTLLDGSVFESEFDRLPENGQLDSLWYRFEEKIDPLTLQSRYAFDFFFDASRGDSNNEYYVWQFNGTYKVDTRPELDSREGQKCEEPDCEGCNWCNIIWKCTGYRNYGTAKNPIFRRIGPCTCCECWYSLYNEVPVISDATFSSLKKVTGVFIASVPVNDYIFRHKVYAQVRQMGVSQAGWRFYKAIRDQKEAVDNLFQPVSGRITGNFRRVSGTAKVPVGLFMAASVRTRTVLLDKSSVPFGTYVFPPQDSLPSVARNCLRLFPNATNLKPAFWED